MALQMGHLGDASFVHLERGASSGSPLMNMSAKTSAVEGGIGFMEEAFKNEN